MRVWSGMLGVAGLMVLAGCGGGGGGYDAPPGNPGAPSPPAASATVSIVGERGAQSFNPNPASVGGARTIAWRNTDSVIHRIMSNDGSFDTGNIVPGATSQTVTLNTDGANYHCTLHPGMIGAINAQSGTPPPCSGPYC